MIFSNVSPGAARAHDPDGHGWVLHRAWAHGPGLRPLEDAEAVASVTLDAAGDAMLTKAFFTRALAGHEAALGVLWLGEPGATQHAVPLGAPRAMAAIAAADARFAQLHAAVAARRAAGDHLLCGVAMATRPAPNEHGIPGLAFAAGPAGAKPDRLGRGQHGGLSEAEQMPFLMIEGLGFAAGTTCEAPTSPIDLAPTTLRHLRLPGEGCDGKPLQTPTGENDHD